MRITVECAESFRDQDGYAAHSVSMQTECETLHFGIYAHWMLLTRSHRDVLDEVVALGGVDAVPLLEALSSGEELFLNDELVEESRPAHSCPA